MSRFLSFKQICEVLHLSRSRINQLLAEGQFPKPHKLSPAKSGRVIWPAEAVDAWLAERAPKEEAAELRSAQMQLLAEATSGLTALGRGGRS